jgi:hypothetical protein
MGLFYLRRVSTDASNRSNLTALCCAALTHLILFRSTRRGAF